MELNQFLRQRVLRVNVLVHIVRVDRNLTLALTDYLLELLVFLLQGLNVPIDNSL